MYIYVYVCVFFSNNKSIRDNPEEKRPRDFKNRYFTKEETHMANKFRKRFYHHCFRDMQTIVR